MHATNQIGDEIDRLGKPNELLVWLQNKSPELLAEDAFVVPLWFLQQGTWLEDPANSDSSVYNYPLLLRIRGPLKQDILQQSLQEIVRRHEVLRSVFRNVNGELVQIVVPPEKLTLRVVDLSKGPEPEREARIQQIALAEAHEPFDLARGPLLRSALIRIGADDHILQLTTHHIVHDDWSTGILSRELSELYQAFAAGAESPLPDLAFQYGDYVRWLQKQLQGNALRSRLLYWKEQLASATGFQHLATDFARPEKSATANRGAREGVALPTDLANSLKELSRQERVSLFMVLLAGFQALLHHRSNDEEIGVASCAANRPLAEVEGVIGRFGNDILFRTSLSGNPTIRELLMRVRKVALDAYSDQDLPFGECLKDRLNGSDSNRELPFQVMFILQNAPKENRQIQGLSMSWIPFYAGTAKYDLNVWLKIDSTLEVILEYRPDLFRAATMKQILADYQAVLETMAKDPGARVCNLLISRRAEPAQVLPPPTVAKEMLEAKDSAAPQDDVESRLVELWEAAFEIRAIGIDQDFFELGGDSLLAARLFTRIEKTFEMDLPLAALLEAPSIKQLAGTIRGRKTCSSKTYSMVVVQPSGTKPPLFCIPGHGGGIVNLRNLSRFLGTDQPLVALTPQGHSGEKLNKTVEDMATHYLREIRTVQSRGPYFLSGLCFGGMVAYEIARLLKTQGEEVALLALFNTPSPGALKGWPFGPKCLTKRIAYELRKLRAIQTKEKLAVFGRQLAGLTKVVRAGLQRALWRALPKSSDADTERGAGRLRSVANLNILAAKAYRPPPYGGRIILFLTEEVGSKYTVDPARGWADLAAEGIEIYPVAGDNVSFLHADIIEALAEKLRFCIVRVHCDHKELPGALS
jgi:thioesterase domain-containing protein/acyl carrier protein